MATFATPGTAISRGRIVHSATVVMSICDSVFDVMPIFSARLSDDSGDSSTGALATAGRPRLTRASRSCTSWRACIRSAPCVRISTTDDSPSTDFDRIVATSGTPVSALSIGTLTNDSTSSADRPGASVCTSISGGANSGNTSNGTERMARAPATAAMTVSTQTTIAWRSESETSQRSMAYLLT